MQTSASKLLQESLDIIIGLRENQAGAYDASGAFFERPIIRALLREMEVQNGG